MILYKSQFNKHLHQVVPALAWAPSAGQTGGEQLAAENKHSILIISFYRQFDGLELTEISLKKLMIILTNKFLSPL